MPTVLVIEDDHETRVALRELLEGEGFAVLTATNGFEGYAKLQSLSGPAVVVLDQNLPLANGDEFLELKEGNRRLRHVPVIVVSAVGDRLSRLGIARFLPKPIDARLLVETIREQFPAAAWATSG